MRQTCLLLLILAAGYGYADVIGEDDIAGLANATDSASTKLRLMDGTHTYVAAASQEVFRLWAYQNSGNTTGNDVEVGVYDVTSGSSAATLITSGVISGDSNGAGWKFVEVAPVALVAGNTYAVAWGAAGTNTEWRYVRTWDSNNAVNKHNTLTGGSALPGSWTSGGSFGHRGAFYAETRTIPTYTPLIKKDFESDTVGAVPAGIGTTDDLVSTYHAASGNNSWNLTLDSGETGFGDWGGIVTFPTTFSKGDEIWSQVKVYWPSGESYDASPYLKFLRYRNYTAAGAGTGYADVYIAPSTSSKYFRWIKEGEGIWSDFGSSRVAGDTWETWEYYIRLDDVDEDSGGSGVVRVWRNCSLILEETSLDTLVNATDYVSKLYLFTYWNGGAPEDISIYVDDIEIASSDSPPLNTDAAANAYIGGCT